MSNKETQLLRGSNGLPITLDIQYGNTAGKQPVVIYAHGFNGFKDWGSFDLIAQTFVRAGFTFVKFNFSHNGTSPENPEAFVNLEAFGQNNYSRQLHDLKVVIDWVSDPDNPYASRIDKDKVGLIGHSMGGGIAIIKAAEDLRIKALVSWAAISECKTPWGKWSDEKIKEWQEKGVAYYTNGRTGQQMPLYYQLYEDYTQNRERLDISRAASELKIPFLICHGTKDTSVSPHSAEEIHQAAPGSALFWVESDHVFGRRHPWPESFLPPPTQDIVRESIELFKKELR